MKTNNLNKIKEFLQSVGADLSKLDVSGRYNCDLYFRGCTGLTSITFPEGMAIGGGLYFGGCTGLTPDMQIIQEHVEDGFVWEWRDRRYIKADGIFTRLLTQRGNVYKVARIGRNEETYLVTDGAGKWAHGATLDEARRDLIYKISNRDTSRYEGLTLDSEMTYEEAIVAYRVITGACAAGTRDFCKNILPESERRAKYTVAEIVKLTAGHYGAESFRKFFEK